MTKRPKVGISVRAVLQRINRKLKPDLQAVKVSRGAAMQQQCGEFYVIDYRLNFIVESDIDPESYARELGVLQGWETVAGAG